MTRQKPPTKQERIDYAEYRQSIHEKRATLPALNAALDAFFAGWSGDPALFEALETTFVTGWDAAANAVAAVQASFEEERRDRDVDD